MGVPQECRLCEYVYRRCRSLRHWLPRCPMADSRAGARYAVQRVGPAASSADTTLGARIGIGFTFSRLGNLDPPIGAVRAVPARADCVTRTKSPPKADKYPEDADDDGDNIRKTQELMRRKSGRDPIESIGKSTPKPKIPTPGSAPLAPLAPGRPTGKKSCP